MAVNIQFVNNLNLDSLRKDFEKGAILKGYLKKVEDRFYVKDIETYLFIRLVVSKYEVDVWENYEQRLNDMVQYKIVRFTSNNQMAAIVSHRKFSVLFEEVLLSKEMDGVIISRARGGFNVAFGNDDSGFIPGSMAGLEDHRYVPGMQIRMQCVGYHAYHDTYVFQAIKAPEHS